MTFTAGNLFPSHSCIGVTRVNPPPRFEPGAPEWEEGDHLSTELFYYVVWFNFMPINATFVHQFLPMDSENDFNFA